MLTSSEVRPILQQLAALELPDVAVLAYQELDPNLSITARETLRPVADKAGAIVGEFFDKHWVDAALEMFGRVLGGATAYPKAKGIWRDEQRDGTLVKDEPVVVHCYTTPADIEDSENLAEL